MPPNTPEANRRAQRTRTAAYEARVDKRQRATPHLDPKAAGLSLAMVTQGIPAPKALQSSDTPSNDGDGVSRDVAPTVLCRAKRSRTLSGLNRNATGVQASGSRRGCKAYQTGAKGRPKARRKGQQSERGNHDGRPPVTVDGHLRLTWPSWGGGTVVVGGGESPPQGEGSQSPEETRCERKS